MSTFDYVNEFVCVRESSSIGKPISAWPHVPESKISVFDNRENKRRASVHLEILRRLVEQHGRDKDAVFVIYEDGVYPRTEEVETWCDRPLRDLILSADGKKTCCVLLEYDLCHGFNDILKFISSECNPRHPCMLRCVLGKVGAYCITTKAAVKVIDHYDEGLLRPKFIDLLRRGGLTKHTYCLIPMTFDRRNAHHPILQISRRISLLRYYKMQVLVFLVSAMSMAVLILYQLGIYLVHASGGRDALIDAADKCLNYAHSFLNRYRSA